MLDNLNQKRQFKGREDKLSLIALCHLAKGGEFMFPVIEVQCPFCKATGQIVAPTLGSIIIGPCPRCNETVLIFNGWIMPLDKDVINHGSLEDKKEHVLDTIIDIIQEKLDELFDEEKNSEANRKLVLPKPKRGENKKVKPSVRKKKAPPISREEVRDFVNIDLQLINSKAYFEKIFGKKGK